MERAIARLQEDEEFVRKRRKTLIAFAFRMFLQGVEYSIISPSVWLYLESLGAKPWYLGFVKAIYTVASMISMPVFGRIYDNTRRIQAIVCVTNVFVVAGSFVYALPFSAMMPLLGRMLGGVGDGFYSAANGEISMTYSKGERTRTFAILEGGRILGIVIGPCLNFGLDKVDFWIGTWHINYGTMPGLFMGVVWILASVLCYMFVYNLSNDVAKLALEEATSESSSTDDSDINVHVREGCSSSDGETGVATADETTPLIGKSVSESEASSVSFSGKTSLSSALSDFFGFEMFTVVLADVIICLCMNATDSFAPLATSIDFGWGEDRLSLYYIAIGVEVCLALLFMWYMSNRVRDTTYLLFSLASTVCMQFLYIIYQYERDHTTSGIVVFSLIILLLGITLPTNLVACKSLITKLTGDKAQGITQGLFGSFARLGVALGPLVGTSAFHRLDIMGLVLFSVSSVISGIFVWRLGHIQRKAL